MWKINKKEFRDCQKKTLNNERLKWKLNLERIYNEDRNEFWKKVKRYKKSKNQTANYNSNINIKKFQEFYRELFSHKGIEENTQHKEIENKVKNEMDKIKNEMYSNTFDTGSVETAIKSLKNGKATGIDHISNEMLKYAENNRLMHIITLIFDDIVKYVLKLSNFNISVINPIPKTMHASEKPDDYRPISVSNSLCTVYESVILSKTRSIFRFNKKQFGYSRFSSCKHASFIVNETISYYKSGGSPIYAISMDIRKAFDRAWREGIYYKLMDKIDKRYWRAIIKYYESSEGIAKYNHEFSDKFILTQGVKQGGILSPYLFNYFMD